MNWQLAAAKNKLSEVMTRNTKHFAAAGAPILDPWEA